MAASQNRRNKLKGKYHKTNISKELQGKIGAATTHRKQRQREAVEDTEAFTLLPPENDLVLEDSASELLSTTDKQSYITQLIQTRDYLSAQLEHVSDESFKNAQSILSESTEYTQRDDYLLLIESLTTEVLEGQLNTYDDYRYAMAHLQLAIEHLQEIQDSYQLQSESQSSVELLEEDVDDGLSSIDFTTELEKQTTYTEQAHSQAPNQDTTEYNKALEKSILEIVKAHISFYEKLKIYQHYINAEHNGISANHNATLEKFRQILQNQFKDISIDEVLAALKAHEEERETLSLEEIAALTSLAIQFSNTDNKGLLAYLHIKEVLLDFPDIISENTYFLSSIDIAWQNAIHIIPEQSAIVSSTIKNLESTIINLQSLQKVQAQLFILRNNKVLDEEINALSQLNDPQHVQSICTQFEKRCEELRINAQRLALEANMPENQENTSLKYQANTAQEEYNKWLLHKPKFSSEHFGTELENINNMFKQYAAMLQTLSKIQISFGHTHDPQKLKQIQSLNLKTALLYKKIKEQYTDSLDIIEEILSNQLESEALSALKPFFEKQKIQSTLKQANVLTQSLKDNPSAKGAFAQQLKLGILFNKRGTEQDAHFYKMLSLGMLADFSEKEILQMGVDGLKHCSHPDDIENALLFIQYCLLNDTENQTVRFDEYESYTLTQLNDILSKLTLERHQASIHAIQDLIEKKHTERIASFSNTIKDLSLTTELSILPQDFSRMIFTQIYKLQKSSKQERDDIYNEFLSWIHHANEIYFQMPNNDLSNPLHAALSFLDEAASKGIDVHTAKEIIFRKKLSPSQTKEIPTQTINISSLSEYNSLLQKIEQVANGTLSEEEKNILSTQLIEMIEAAHTNELIQMSISELSAAGNKIDKKNIEKGIYAQPQSLHFNRNEQISNKIYALLATLVMNQYKEGEMVEREKVSECRRIYDFYNQMLNDAYAQHRYYAFEDIFYAQGYSSIPRFVENNAEREQYAYLFQYRKKYFTKLKSEHNAAPSTDIFIDRFVKAQEGMNSDLLSKYLLIGRSTNQFIDSQATVRRTNQSISPLSDFEAFADSVLFDCYQGACAVSPTTLTIAVNDTALQQAILEQSNVIKPKNLPKAKSLAAFNSITELNHYLKICANREWGYHLIDVPAQEEILNFIKNHIIFSIQKTSLIPDITEIFELLDHMNEIQIYETGETIDPNNVYKIVFEAYDQAMQELPENITNTMLKNFHSQLEQSSHFLSIVENHPKWYEVFSLKRACYNSAIQFENHLLDKIESAPDSVIEYEESSSFVNLLNIVLSGKTPSIFSNDQTIVSGNFAAMMADKEYWVTPYDPEFVEPSQIFLSLSQEKQSALGNFSAKALNAQFCQGLPWALKLDSIDKLSHTSALDKPNLLNTAQPLEKETQLIVMQYLLVSFDIMGKLCGRDGALTLKNYDAIDAVVSNIEKLQADLKTKACLSPDFKKKIGAQLQSLQMQNQQLNVMSQQSKRGFFNLNIDVNNFCHLNEILVHQLLGIPFKTSLLAPQDASPPHRDLITQAMQKPSTNAGFYVRDKENNASNPIVEAIHVTPKIKKNANKQLK
ncbi:hypothetical protein CC99x_005010 [Candidatus Berkiella cookevillensis]|uniref:Uncharacterized protein n=1 Tax=Candidatus Berkiella cookevillensis TaxID=437022 RepID=A0A0Q9YTA6_9GAMM|nr:hypothetical protein [Candidatus Berkiella cookevillensis]MCS5708259.1 hypothetical protein [Candidatus Berkiella cookevillensis]